METVKAAAKKFVSEVSSLVKSGRSSYKYKILLIGETGSGKTSFLNVLCNCDLIQTLGFKEGLGQLQQFNDIKIENAISCKMESKTSGAKLHNVELGELKVDVI